MVVQRPSATYQALIGLLSSSMVVALLASLSAFWRMSITNLALWSVAGLSSAYGWLLWRHPKWAMWVGYAAIGGSLAGVWYLPSWQQVIALTTKEAVDFWTTVREMHLDTTFGPELGYLFLGLIGFGMAMLITGEALTHGKAFWSMAGGLLIFGTQWAWFFDKSSPYFIGYTLAAFALWIVGQAALRDARWVSSGRRIGYRSDVLTPMAWVLALAVFASILPTDFQPVDLGQLGTKLQSALPILSQMRGAGTGGTSSRFSLRATGFSPNMGALGGPVKVDATPALKLTVENPLAGTAYLRGATFQLYDGTTWEPGETELLTIPKDGSLPTSYAADVPKQYSTIQITPLQNLGSTVFSMMEPIRMEDFKGNWKADSDGNLSSDRVIPKGMSYQISVRSPVYSAEQIKLLSTSAPGEALKPYLLLPRTLPKRVGDTARSIASGQQHPFDKALFLEAYLRSLTYSLEVPSTPTGRDFVDHFLFESQKGYCVYFATALTVMLRELNIPARFVEGFAVPASTEMTRDETGKYAYTVLNSQAHAWVEAYFPGYGWVTLDPTPRQDLPRIDRSAALPAANATTEDTTQNDLLDANAAAAAAEAAAADRTKLNDLEGEGGFAPATALTQELPFTGLLLLVLAGLGYLGYRRMQALNRLAATEGRQLVQEAWEKSGSLLGRFGDRRRAHETALEYARALGKAWPALAEPTTQVAEDYTAARYSPPSQPVDSSAPSRARALWTAVRDQVFRRYGWRAYLWQRLRPGRDK